MENLNAVEKEIEKTLKELEERILKWKREQAVEREVKDWRMVVWRKAQATRDVKTALATLGREKGYEVHAKGIDPLFSGREWLYDLIWYKKQKGGFLVDVPLVVESEWGRSGKQDRLGDIVYDFEKLLVANSTQRLLIFEGEDVDAIMADIKERIAAYQGGRIGDRFLLVGWSWRDQKFLFSGPTAGHRRIKQLRNFAQ